MTDSNSDNSPDQSPSNNSERGNDQGQRSNEERGSKTELVFTVFSLVLILSLCGFLIFKSLGEATPPAFKVENSYPARRGSFVAVEVFIENFGDEAAKAVHVSGEMVGSDGQPVEAEGTLDWLPGDSKRQLTLVFPDDVMTTSTPDITIKGYEEP